MAPAIISLPVPDSPVIKTVASEGATWATVSRSVVFPPELAPVRIADLELDTSLNGNMVPAYPGTGPR